MPDISPRDRANAAHSAILNKLPHGTAAKIAEAMGISDKDLSEIKNKSLAPALYLLAHLGYKMVPVGYHCLSPVDFAFLTSLQAKMVRKAPHLQWEDSELGATVPGHLGD